MPGPLAGWGTGQPRPGEIQPAPLDGWGAAGGEAPSDLDLPWVDQLATNILLTVQAVTRLHTAFDGKLTR